MQPGSDACGGAGFDMRLYGSAASPFVRKVLAVSHETGLRDQIELVSVTTSPIDGGTMPAAINPLCKIPALERNDGPALYDSRVICRYLSDLADVPLYPDPPRLWDTLVLEATADGILDAALSMVYEARFRSEEKREPDLVEGYWNKVTRALDTLEARWLAHLAGRMDVGHIAVGAALGYLDFRHAARDWRMGHTSLADWYQVFAERPSMQATQPSD